MPKPCPTHSEKDELWLTVSRFIDKHKITNEYLTVEDRVYENAPPFIEELCDIVGYAKSDDET